MNRYELKKTWQNTTLIRAKQESIRLINGGVLSDVEFDIYCLIGFKPNATITSIVNHPYFKDLSLSTIKRSVGTLICENLIEASVGASDKRERFLNVVEGEL